MTVPSDDVSDPCASCGESTAIGRPLFAGRRVIDHDDGRIYLCATCDEETARSRRGRRLSAEEVRRLVDNGSMAGITWSGDGIGGLGGT
jgi:hypothetical protein